MYLSDERSKQRHTTSSRWVCTKCNKAFRAEDYLDLHFENRHLANRSAIADACLADYCDILRCSPLSGDAVPHEAAVRKHLLANDELCISKGGVAQRAALCRATFQRCFPPSSSDGVHRIFSMCCLLK